jgi:hypothetical protein
MLRQKPGTAKYLSCNIFEDAITKEEILKNNTFTIKLSQDEISIDKSQASRYPFHKDYLKILKTLEISNYPFIGSSTEYNVTFTDLDKIDKEKIPLLLPIKDNQELLEFTLSNLSSNKVMSVANVTVLDDRSEDPDSMHELCRKYGAIYTRIEYDTPYFNFSMLNNIGAYLYNKLNFSEVVFWNADLWTPDASTVPNLIDKYHRYRKSGTRLCGAKLLYPSHGFCDLLDPERTYKEMSQDFRIDLDEIKAMEPFGKVQFGGGSFRVMPEYFDNSHPICGSPYHFGRFLDKSEKAVNIDRETRFVTGAFQIVDLPTFVEVGGFCPSLSCSMQDIDLCLRFWETFNKVTLIGKDIHLYHGESVILSSKLEDDPSSLKHKSGAYKDKLISDEVLYSMLWNFDFFSGRLPA